MSLAQETLIDDLAARQHGVVTRNQLIEAGITARRIGRRLAQGRLRPMHRGVYVSGGVTSPHVREMAAVLACGQGAVLSHRSGAALREFVRHPGSSAPVDVTVPGRDVGRRPGIMARRVARLKDADVTVWNGIPVTTPGRTLIDLAAEGMASRDLEQAVAQAERRGLITREELSAVVAGQPRRRGVRLLRAVLERDGGPLLTRSEAEERLLALIRRGGMPAPAANVAVAGHEVDFMWAPQRLVVEVDGFAFHATRSRFEQDRRRDADLAAAGYRVLRVTWRQITEESYAVLGSIALTLGRADRP